MYTVTTSSIIPAVCQIRRTGEVMILHRFIHHLLLVFSQQTLSTMIPIINLTQPRTGVLCQKLRSKHLSIRHRHELERFPMRRSSAPQREADLPGQDHIHGFRQQSRSPILHNSICSWRQRRVFPTSQLPGPRMDRRDCRAHYSHEDLAEALVPFHHSTYQRQYPIEHTKRPAGKASNHRLHLHDRFLRPCREYFLKVHSRRITPIPHRT